MYYKYLGVQGQSKVVIMKNNFICLKYCEWRARRKYPTNVSLQLLKKKQEEEEIECWLLLELSQQWIKF